METIISVNNARIKDAANLKQKKFRTENGAFIAEGLRAVEEAVQFGIVTDLFFTVAEHERLDAVKKAAEEKGARLFQVDDKVMAKLSDTKTPQGILAVVRIPACSLQRLKPGVFQKQIASGKTSVLQRGNNNEKLSAAAQKVFGSDNMSERDIRIGSLLSEPDNNAPVVILDRIQDPGNLGTIIRTADAVGALGIILLEGCADAYSPKVVRASMGSLFHLPVVQDVTAEEALTWCYRNGYEPAATALNHAQNVYKADLSKKMAFILGNEANGVAEELQAAAETRLFIPMAGQAESMNVAMAAGIILFEGLRQRRFFR